MSLIARRVRTTARRSPQQVDRGATSRMSGSSPWTESKRSLFERSRLQSRNDAGANRQYLFDCWGAVSARIHAVKMIRLFLDFDGTLTTICPMPGDVRLSDAARRSLRRLSRHPRVRVTIVSGRRISLLRKLVRLPGIRLLGLYGFESDEKIALPLAVPRELPRLRAVLRPLPAELPGIRLEDKGISVAIHFRGALADTQLRAKDRIREIVRKFQPGFHIIKTHSAWEIAPRQVEDKGAALRKELKGLRKSSLTIFVGDDLTDEPAFAVLPRGITVHVGRTSRTKARFWLRDPEEVAMFLGRIVEELT